MNIAIAFDQLCNAILAGTPDETLSARAYRNKDCGKKRWALAHTSINILFFWQPMHCLASYLAEMDRKHLPKEYQNGRSADPR